MPYQDDMYDQILGEITGPKNADIVTRALELDPSILEPPPRTKVQRVADALNSGVNALGVIFHNEGAIDSAKQFRQERDAGEKKAAQAKLLRAMRAATFEAQEKLLAEQAAKKRQDYIGVFDKLLDDGLAVRNPDGSVRQPTMEEGLPIVESYIQRGEFPEDVGFFEEDLAVQKKRREETDPDIIQAAARKAGLMAGAAAREKSAVEEAELSDEGRLQKEENKRRRMAKAEAAGRLEGNPSAGSSRSNLNVKAESVSDIESDLKREFAADLTAADAALKHAAAVGVDTPEAVTAKAKQLEVATKIGNKKKERLIANLDRMTPSELAPQVVNEHLRALDASPRDKAEVAKRLGARVRQLFQDPNMDLADQRRLQEVLATIKESLMRGVDAGPPEAVP